MAELFDVGIPAINKHLKKIFEEDELRQEVVISKPLNMVPSKERHKRKKFCSITLMQ